VFNLLLNNQKTEEKKPEEKKPEEKKPEEKKPEEKKPTPKKANTTSFKLKEKFICGPFDLYECFANPNRVRAYAGEGLISGEKGGKSVLFGGSVETENVELIPGKKIVQKWRFKEWAKDYFSTVTLEFETKDNKTILNLSHEGVPDSDKDRAEQGWSANYFTRIKGIFGYGNMVF